MCVFGIKHFIMFPLISLSLSLANPAYIRSMVEICAVYFDMGYQLCHCRLECLIKNLRQMSNINYKYFLFPVKKQSKSHLQCIYLLKQTHVALVQMHQRLTLFISTSTCLFSPIIDHYNLQGTITPSIIRH